MDELAKKLKAIEQAIHQAERQYHRPNNSVKLLAVSKGQPIEKIQAASCAGQKYFGENYLQEAIPKIIALANENLEWHYIGNIQSNKTKAIAENFNWIQSVTRIKIAERLNQQRPVHLPPLNICIEVNISEEKNKTGIFLSQLEELANAIQQMSKLNLRGLMTIPATTDNFEQQRNSYQKLYYAFQRLNNSGFSLDTLSMGMSNDFVAAIAEGSTMVRIGTAIFGPRV